jgi:hypothetical protein
MARRRAGAPTEVTPAMIEAGVWTFERLMDVDSTSEFLVREVFLEMDRIRKGGTFPESSAEEDHDTQNKYAFQRTGRSLRAFCRQ